MVGLILLPLCLILVLVCLAIGDCLAFIFTGCLGLLGFGGFGVWNFIGVGCDVLGFASKNFEFSLIVFTLVLAGFFWVLTPVWFLGFICVVLGALVGLMFVLFAFWIVWCFGASCLLGFVNFSLGFGVRCRFCGWIWVCLIFGVGGGLVLTCWVVFGYVFF